MKMMGFQRAEGPLAGFGTASRRSSLSRQPHHFQVMRFVVLVPDVFGIAVGANGRDDGLAVLPLRYGGARVISRCGRVGLGGGQYAKGLCLCSSGAVRISHTASLYPRRVPPALPCQTDARPWPPHTVFHPLSTPGREANRRSRKTGRWQPRVPTIGEAVA